jgi:hypothetical protein
MKKPLLIALFALFFGNMFGQLEEMTPSEVRYRDSIKALNLQNEAVA